MYGEIIFQLIGEFQRDFPRKRHIPLECRKLQRGFRMSISVSQIQVTREVD